MRGKTAKAEERARVKKLQKQRKKLERQNVESEGKCLRGKTAKAEERV